MNITITAHAKFEAGRRKISEKLIRSVVYAPQQKLPSEKGRVILQNIYYDKNQGKDMLLRVIGVETSESFKVVTVYKTSRIKKYWTGG